jgi:adenosylhomocysteine nucleosidase
MKQSRIGFVTGLSAEARILRRAGFLVQPGGGTPDGAYRAAQKLLDDGAEALVSFGLAGGLSQQMAAGTVLVPKAVQEDIHTYPCDYHLMERLGGPTGHTILAAKRIAATAHEKALLHRKSRADAVDLESGAVARAARAGGVPFAVLRAIVDTADVSLAAAAMVPLKPGGGIDLPGVLVSVLVKPWQTPGLLRLANAASRARKALVERVKKIR